MFYLILTLLAKPVLLDKMALICNEEVYPLSIIKSISKNIDLYKMHLPMIFSDVNTDKEIVDVLIKHFLIRATLEEQGRPITDIQIRDSVESVRKRNNLSSSDFIKQLEMDNITYNDYLFITRLGHEYSAFLEIIAGPQISITDAELMDYYTKTYQKKVNEMIRKYTLVDFSIDKSKLTGDDLKNITKTLTLFRESGDLPSNLSSLETNDLGELALDSLSTDISNLVKKAKKETFTEPILIDETYHLFFIKNITTERSNEFQTMKDQITQELWQEKAKSIEKGWVTATLPKYYVKSFL